MKRLRLLGSLLTTVILIGSVVGASTAFFSDTETASGNVMRAGGFDLLLNGSNDTEAVVSFDDLKPGDNMVVEKSLRIDDNPGRVWLHIKDLESGPGGEASEPEQVYEDEHGEQHDIENYLTYGLYFDEQNPIIATNSGVLLPEVVSCWIPLGEVNGGENVSLYQMFNFDDQVGNWAQGDTLEFVEEFYAIQGRNNVQGPPESDRVWNLETQKCEDRLLWIIGDEETGPLENPVDELNFVGFGNFPNPPAIGDAYTRKITAAVDDVADKEFPWNSNFGADYGRDINVEFSNDSGSPINARLSVGWSPGKSALERKEVLLDAESQGFIEVTGVSTPGWWQNMPRYVDTFEITLSPGSHVIQLLHLTGDGTLWDFVKLERI